MSAEPTELVPGVRPMRPDDHFMVLAETDASPMHVGALLLLDVPEAERAGLADAFRRQLDARLPATPLLARLVQAPDGFDSDVWADVAKADLSAHVLEEGSCDVHDRVAQLAMERLDLARPPFIAHVFPEFAAVYFKMHHSVADGIGFQEVLRLLSDEVPAAVPRTRDAELPAVDDWRALSDKRLAAAEPERTAHAARRKEALGALDLLGEERSPTPMLKLSGPTSTKRAYATMDFPLAGFKAVAAALDATINDLFLACAGEALREYLLARDDLPDAPLVLNSARSYRRPEHGAFGNRIVAIHPHIATHLVDPIERLQAIQESMAQEMRRTRHDEALLDAPEKPDGARDRRSFFAQRTEGGGRVLPGNITLSNVPGPAGERSYAGYRQRHNYPVPIIGSGRFLNITSRRSGASLDMGVIVDSEKIARAETIVEQFRAAYAVYEGLAGA